MNQRIHEWLDAHELLKFLLVICIAVGLNVFTNAWMLKHCLPASIIYALVAGWFIITRLVYLRKGGVL